jgi:hypothetical protein
MSNYLCKIHKEMLIYKQLIPLTPYNALCTNCLKKKYKGIQLSTTTYYLSI